MPGGISTGNLVIRQPAENVSVCAAVQVTDKISPGEQLFCQPR